VETYELVGLAELLSVALEPPYKFKREIGPCSDDQAVVSAYGIVGQDKTPGVAEYRLLKTGWTAQDVAGGILIHRLNVPVCDECWEKTAEKPQTSYWNKSPALERCRFCGRDTSNGLFARFPSA
jgi:hypothetical protein